MNNSGASGTAGRRRDASIDAAVLDAAFDLLADYGYAALNMSAVAERAGIHRPALYRRWPSKLDLASDVMLEVLGNQPTPVTGDLRADLIAGISTLRKAFSLSPVAHALPAILTEVVAEPASRERFLREVLRPRRQSTLASLVAAADRGEIRHDFDAEFALDALAAPLYYRALFRHEPIDSHAVELSVDMVLTYLEYQDGDR